MDVRLINPFIEATVNVVTTMANLQVEAGKPAVKQDRKTWGEVTGIIGFTGYQANGNMLLSFDKPTILKVVSAMLMEEFTEVDDSIVDAVGELTNMVSGGAKGKLSELGFHFEMARPVMIVGSELEVKQLGETPVIQIVFSTEAGSFAIEASLEMNT